MYIITVDLIDCQKPCCSLLQSISPLGDTALLGGGSWPAWPAVVSLVLCFSSSGHFSEHAVPHKGSCLSVPDRNIFIALAHMDICMRYVCALSSIPTCGNFHFQLSVLLCFWLTQCTLFLSTRSHQECK